MVEWLPHFFVHKMTQKQLKQAETNVAETEEQCTEMQQELSLTEQEFAIVEKKLLETLKQHSNLSHKITEIKCNVEKLKTDLKIHTNEIKEKTTIKTNLNATLCHYRKFETCNISTISKIKLKYDKMQKKMEQIWYQWDVQQIVFYLKYKCKNDYNYNVKNKCDDIDTAEIDFDLVEKNMLKDNFKAKYLSSIDKSDLQRFGITNSQHCTQVYNVIKALCNNNPKLNDGTIRTNDDSGGKEVEGQVDIYDSDDASYGDDGGGNGKIFDTNGNKVNIDSKYLCPITQKIMECPVIAYDGNCYEKNEIIRYWRQHGKSPITNDNIDDVELVISLLYQNQSLKNEISQLASI